MVKHLLWPMQSLLRRNLPKLLPRDINVIFGSLGYNDSLYFLWIAKKTEAKMCFKLFIMFTSHHFTNGGAHFCPGDKVIYFAWLASHLAGTYWCNKAGIIVLYNPDNCRDIVLVRLQTSCYILYTCFSLYERTEGECHYNLSVSVSVRKNKSLLFIGQIDYLFPFSSVSLHLSLCLTLSNPVFLKIGRQIYPYSNREKVWKQKRKDSP